jgi:prepilin-type N-terminal cleavage/methylation domain-containing protein/prepilin-type processing-associated H-X9-DG protein
MRSFSSRRLGFTLVELLVVIGIIAILIGVLLPVLAGARRSANKVKCQSQLREVGNALKLYQGEYAGYWPVVQHQASGTFPVNRPYLRTPAAQPRNDYWYMFLLKYFSKKQYNAGAGKKLNDFMGTPLWGCPQVAKIEADSSTSSAEFNSGYGMGPYALYTEQRYLGVNSGPVPAQGIPVKGDHWAMINGDVATGNQGQYFKMTQWARPGTKCIISDSRSWFAETRSVASAAAIVEPTPIGAMGYDGAASHQFDMWRHSRRRGGKNPMSLNMLFVDGHVAEISDVTEAFKAMRGHFPQ